MNYIEKNDRTSDCIFCTALQQEDGPANLIVHRGEQAFAILNRYPYTSGHLMIVPYAHVSSLNELSSEVRAEMMELSNLAVEVLKENYHPEAFNLGLNIGAAAGAGVVGHIHIHVVPRWNGDTNFMSTLANTRVIPEALEDTFKRISTTWSKSFSPGPSLPGLLP